jgi:hypothetical protein
MYGNGYVMKCTALRRQSFAKISKGDEIKRNDRIGTVK